MSILIRGMKGLGDNIYQRACVREIAKQEAVYLETPWPELYSDLPIRFVRRETPLRTQMKNLQRQPAHRWSDPPNGIRAVRNQYGFPPGIVEGMARALSIDPNSMIFDLPEFPAVRLNTDRPIAVIRPVTERREWPSRSRNSKPEYVAKATAILRERGFYTISLADVDEDSEWFIGKPQETDLAFHHGEILVEKMMALIRQAAVVVGSVGWIVPACIATGTPLFCLLGGRGAHNAPEVITHRSMDLSRVMWATPDCFCRCDRPTHECDKTITDVSGKLERFLDETVLRDCRTARCPESIVGGDPVSSGLPGICVDQPAELV